MTEKFARADITPVRQRTQYTCMSTSMAMCLQALGHDVTEDEVNRVMGARPMKGASWEQALACAQHYGCRATLTMPSTVKQLREWTDAGSAVMIAWNPEGRDWSHASTVFDVTDELPSPVPAHCTVISDKGSEGPWVWVADPNIPNPEKTVRICSSDDFYGKWYEKWPDYLVRRPACAIEREITPRGRQVMANSDRVASGFTTANKLLETYAADPSGYNKSELSDWGINTFREGAYEIGYSRSDMEAILKEEARRVRGLKGTPEGLRAYTRMNRAGSKFRLTRKMRIGLFCQLVAVGVVPVPSGRMAARVTEQVMTKLAEPYDCYRDGLRGRALADCYMRFPYDLGPSEIGLIQKHYPDWYPPRRGPSGPPPALKEAIHKNLLAFGLQGAATKNFKSIEFLKDLNGRGGTLSPKQQQWLAKIIQANTRYTRNMPDGVVILTVYRSGLIFFDFKKSSASAKRWVEQNAYFEERSDSWLILGSASDKPKEAPAAPEPAPSAPSGGSDPKLKAKRLEVLGLVLNKYPDDSFLQGMRKLIENDRPLSDNQLSAIRRKLYMSRMKPEADHFRTAAHVEAVRKAMDKMARAKRKNKPQSMKDKMKTDLSVPKQRDPGAKALAEKSWGSGKHHNRDRDVAKGRNRKPKHKNRNLEATLLAILRLAGGPSYQDYVDRKKGKGEKPLPKDEWERKVLNTGVSGEKLIIDKSLTKLLGDDVTPENAESKRGAIENRIKHLKSGDYSDEDAKAIFGGTLADHEKALKALDDLKASKGKRDESSKGKPKKTKEQVQKEVHDSHQRNFQKNFRALVTHENTEAAMNLPEYQPLEDAVYAHGNVYKPLRDGGDKKTEDERKAEADKLHKAWAKFETAYKKKFPAKKAGYKGNPDGKPIYPNQIDHGTDTEPLAGGHDVMRRLQNKLIHEQGDVVPQRPESPKVARYLLNRPSLKESAARVAAAWLKVRES